MKVAFNITLPQEDIELLTTIMSAKRLNRSQSVHYLLMVALKSLRDVQLHKQKFQKEMTYLSTVKQGGVVKPLDKWKPTPREIKKDEKPIKPEQTKKDKHKKILP